MTSRGGQEIQEVTGRGQTAILGIERASRNAAVTSHITLRHAPNTVVASNAQCSDSELISYIDRLGEVHGATSMGELTIERWIEGTTEWTSLAC